MCTQAPVNAGRESERGRRRKRKRSVSIVKQRAAPADETRRLRTRSPSMIGRLSGGRLAQKCARER
ncbi:hypothetical protein T4E_4740 [Trichinella pseudospiralis]|uniref:Uncharacterized protein n=1 Tax=Trichinella pseudospiralis TaxID=6337 RepID=A0A0V0YCM8_TRIPS|nr:hypothetical protein T4E_4740 [Trichinella pseudospiralis]